MNSNRSSAVAFPNAGYGRAPGRLERLLLTPALVDWVLAGYFSAVFIGLTRAAPSPARNTYMVFTGVVMALFVSGVYLYRLRFEARASYMTRLAYHLLPVCAVLFFYLNLRPILPIINPHSYDEHLYRLDIRIFGLEPTLAIQHYVTRGVVEWFAFFYFSYFHLIASYVFVMIVSCRDDIRLASFATGLIIVVAVGHFIYMLVPGFGPYFHLAHLYDRPLRGGVFYGMVLDAVSRGGPLRDIFPSLHTALPTYCALYAWRHHPRIAIVTTFFAANIMVATIVLRWHYAADVVVGLILAITAIAIASPLVEAYQARREAAGLVHLRRW